MIDLVSFVQIVMCVVLILPVSGVWTEMVHVFTVDLVLIEIEQENFLQIECECAQVDREHVVQIW